MPLKIILPDIKSYWPFVRNTVAKFNHLWKLVSNYYLRSDYRRNRLRLQLSRLKEKYYFFCFHNIDLNLRLRTLLTKSECLFPTDSYSFSSSSFFLKKRFLFKSFYLHLSVFQWQAVHIVILLVYTIIYISIQIKKSTLSFCVLV